MRDDASPDEGRESNCDLTDLEKAKLVEQALAPKVTCRRCGAILDIPERRGVRQRLSNCYIEANPDSGFTVRHGWSDPI
jgi:hypothetical protein